MIIPNTENFNKAIPVSGKVDKCPRCDNPHLGQMITLYLEYCPCCDTWLRYAKGKDRHHKTGEKP